MFTGIIEETGTVKSIEKRGASGRISIGAVLDLATVGIGGSIAVDGACLTVTGFSNGVFRADVSEETLRLTTLGGLVSGSKVNLERPLTLSKPLGGHFVTGHIDGLGTLRLKESRGDFLVMEVVVPPGLLRQVVKKGSVAVDGISLTVAELGDGFFSVAVIPHTLKNTTLSAKAVGSRLNIETDVIGKYVERFMGAASDKGVTEDFLAEHGFMNGRGE